MNVQWMDSMSGFVGWIILLVVIRITVLLIVLLLIVLLLIRMIAALWKTWCIVVCLSCGYVASSRGFVHVVRT